MHGGENWYYHTTLDPKIIISFVNIAMPSYTADLFELWVFFPVSLYVTYPWIFYTSITLDITYPIVFHMTWYCMTKDSKCSTFNHRNNKYPNKNCPLWSPKFHTGITLCMIPWSFPMIMSSLLFLAISPSVLSSFQIFNINKVILHVRLLSVM